LNDHPRRGQSLLQSDLLHQAREIGIFLGDQVTEGCQPVRLTSNV
jgi:hypothetical protein